MVSYYAAVRESLTCTRGNHSRDLTQNDLSRMSIRSTVLGMVATASLLILAFGCGGATPQEPSTPTPMKVGLLLNFSASPETAADRKRAFDLAILHVNQAGGVLGRPVEGVAADPTRDPQMAVEAARRLVETEGIHAIVGPSASVAALPIAEAVSGPARIPTISPSATSPQLTVAADNDYFYRLALSDTAQGLVLARVTRERGFDNVGVIYRDDPYGRGLAKSFEESWNGTIRSVSVDALQTTYLPELLETVSEGAQALVVITFEQQALSIVREALDQGIYSQFTFGDAAKRIGLVTELGGERLGGMYGTAGAPAADSAASEHWEAAFLSEYGGPVVLTYVKETYDATVALALAAQAAGSLEGAAIRDQLRAIASPPGETVLGTPSGVADGLRLLAEGREINYDGVASSVDWDENGDLLRGYIGTWRFTDDERIEELDVVFFEY